jgi:hypothetical protein
MLLSLIKYQSKKAYAGFWYSSHHSQPRHYMVLNVSTTPRPLYLRAKVPGNHWIRIKRALELPWTLWTNATTARAGNRTPTALALPVIYSPRQRIGQLLHCVILSSN